MNSRTRLRKAIGWFQLIQRHTLFTPIKTELTTRTEDGVSIFELTLFDNGRVIGHSSLSTAEDGLDKYMGELMEILATLPKYGIKLQ